VEILKFDALYFQLNLLFTGDLMKAPDDLILLFYDGFECRAEERFLPWVRAQLRQNARFVWRTLRRKQVHTGYHTAFRNLCLALRSQGFDLRVNDFAAARRYPDHPIGIGGYSSVFQKVEGLPNPRLIGPGPFNSPSEAPNLMDDPRNRYFMQRCAWMKDLFARYYPKEKLFAWYRGFDVNRFEDTRSVPKTYDVLVYDKIYHGRDYHYPRTIGRFLEHLEGQGLRYYVVRYGAYNNQDYLAALRVSRSLAFFAHSETQGHACQEAMAMNTPVFAWDEGVWLDPFAKQITDEPIPCTSVPNFDERCGVRFKMEDMLQGWADFWQRVDTFTPRALVSEELSLKGSADLYMKAYREAGGLPVIAHPPG
jgi:hypothetical protein